MRGISPKSKVQSPKSRGIGSQLGSCALLPESAGKPDALQTLREISAPGKQVREAFGVRPACRRFRFSSAMHPYPPRVYSDGFIARSESGALCPNSGDSKTRGIRRTLIMEVFNFQFSIFNF